MHVLVNFISQKEPGRFQYDEINTGGVARFFVYLTKRDTLQHLSLNKTLMS